MYERIPTKEEANAAGFEPEDYLSDPVEVWPENWPVYCLFAQLQTQWRSSGMGLLGLDYNTLFHKMDRMSLAPEEYDQMESDIRAMEYAALEAMQAGA